MTYADLYERALVAIYKEDRGGFQSFYQAIKLHGLAEYEKWLPRAVEEAAEQGLIAIAGGNDVNTTIFDVQVRLSGKGLRYIATNYFPPEAELQVTSNAVQSAEWTGLPTTFQLTDERRQRLVTLLEDAESSLDALGVGNSEKAMARAYIIATRALAEAPDPPVDLIWELIDRANSIAGVASLFVSLIALFTAAQ